MLNIYNNRREFYNKNMMDYCRKSTEESIKKMIEREKNKPKFTCTINAYNNTNNEVVFNIFSLRENLKIYLKYFEEIMFSFYSYIDA